MHIERHHAKYWEWLQTFYTPHYLINVIGCQLTVVDSFLFFCPFIKHNINNSGEKACSGF